MTRIGWFSTGRDKAARDLLKTVYREIKKGNISAQISFVFSNRELGESEESDKFFALVKRYSFPLVTFSSAKFKPDLRKENMKLWREEYHHQVIELLNIYSVDLIVLAGYMLIVSRELCEKYKLINLHPAKPGGPKGTWQEVIWQLIRNKEKESGVMMHLVTPELDAGPPISYCIYPIIGRKFDRLWKELDGKVKTENLEQIIKKEGENEPLFKKIRQEGLKREFPLIVQTIKSFASGKIKIVNGQVYANGQPHLNGFDLTKDIK